MSTDKKVLRLGPATAIGLWLLGVAAGFAYVCWQAEALTFSFLVSWQFQVSLVIAVAGGFLPVAVLDHRGCASLDRYLRPRRVAWEDVSSLHVRRLLGLPTLMLHGSGVTFSLPLFGSARKTLVEHVATHAQTKVPHDLVRRYGR
ncbi:hypothetical protein PEC18_38750 [Paucibacter sp. O1-1]|nr:hypothetical protein [Paucibacter sp. O1-1]MDA3831554.1 hypothetical protein [Paucibacter sp. O1-1]